ncbi:MAG TPA: cold-shock protein [bacterium (Candidatus Stahlbacteria)]|nr:cold-shock protein [Candidatus Stahlbacteria bacterium]
MPLLGVVKWFNSKLGYGFISREDGEGDVFVHYSDVTGTGYRTLREGEKVKFELAESPKGLKATNVERAVE